MKKILLFTIAIAVASVLQAQTSQTPSDTLTKRELRKLKRAEKVREGKFLITPLVGPAYTPELGFTIAGGILTSWRTDKTDSTLQRSSAPINVGWGSNGAVFVSSKLTTFWNHDKIRANADVWFKNMNDNYFGVGYDTNEHTSKSDTTTQYKRQWFQVKPQVLWQFKKKYCIGGILDLNYTKGKNPCEQVANDPYYVKYNDQPFNSGLGIIIQIDSRDIAVNAWKGWFVDVDATFYGHYLGGQNNYQVYNIDVRHYIKIVKPGHTLALQLRSRFAVNDVPYGEMSELGTPFDLRGYLWGQYRDKSMLFGIAEYRHTFYKKDGKPSKHGVVGWIAGGSIAPDVAFKNWLPNGGIGYRLEVQPRMNLRLDFGLGKNTRGFYFNFNEAF